MCRPSLICAHAVSICEGQIPRARAGQKSLLHDAAEGLGVQWMPGDEKGKKANEDTESEEIWEQVKLAGVCLWMRVAREERMRRPTCNTACCMWLDHGLQFIGSLVLVSYILSLSYVSCSPMYDH
jgi:hypothetical protein